jgi:UDPglucose--hexose-1-phosphate uridylyltransferase
MFLADRSHRRFNPLTGEWVLVSPHRTKRPWQGRTEDLPAEKSPSHDPKCYLCPGNKRAEGAVNPDYKGVYVFTNDFSALLPDGKKDSTDEHGLLRAETESGKCRVVCFSPRHDLTLPLMDPAGVAEVVRVWKEQYEELSADPSIRHVQIFENRGEVMGCSNPHPHGQIWAQESLPTLVALEDSRQTLWKKEKGTCLLCEYAAFEAARGDRVVCRNDRFVALVPFWAVWPFEVMVLPLDHCRSLSDLDGAGIAAFADILRSVGIRYDNLFRVSFPYSMGIHQAPVGADDSWHLHVHYYPPLLRSATVRKFMVGYELLCMPQRDITPESAAERLRGLSGTHFSLGSDGRNG